MPQEQQCPQCGRETVSDTGGEFITKDEDGNEKSAPVLLCSSCGWSSVSSRS